MVKYDDTIVALSTPPGRGGIAVIRLNGPDAFQITLSLFRNPTGRPLSRLSSHKAVHGFIVQPQSGDYADEVVMTPMAAPNSYTGEDVVEISCHGGPGPVEAIISLCMEAGARPAEPGEFTRRAFINNRMDLAQAEAVADLIDSQARAGASTALEQLRGGLSREVASMSEGLTQCLVNLEAVIDFPEEDLPPSDIARLRRQVDDVRERTLELAGTYQVGRIAREGMKVVIAGKPNVGKSTLLNALLEDERAIVTPVPGTTRDSIEETLGIGGIHFRLTDTAGIRAVEDEVEQKGVDRTLKLLEEADLCLLVFDSSRDLDQDDRMAMDATEGVRTLEVINKTDLTPRWKDQQLKQTSNGEEPVKISAKKGWGLDKLKEAMGRLSGWGPTEGMIITRARHREALAEASVALERVLRAMDEGLSPEFPAADLYLARNSLDSILGVHCSEDVLNRIFDEFCIGK